jgi:hypothetical protein
LGAFWGVTDDVSKDASVVKICFFVPVGSQSLSWLVLARKLAVRTSRLFVSISRVSSIKLTFRPVKLVFELKYWSDNMGRTVGAGKPTPITI